MNVRNREERKRLTVLGNAMAHCILFFFFFLVRLLFGCIRWNTDGGDQQSSAWLGWLAGRQQRRQQRLRAPLSHRNQVEKIKYSGHNNNKNKESFELFGCSSVAAAAAVAVWCGASGKIKCHDHSAALKSTKTLPPCALGFKYSSAHTAYGRYRVMWNVWAHFFLFIF